ncbi:CNPV021 ankyrin repeat protein [Canarypox virus]|uniref:CNPV021 ankyrin repeat protein n=1 Tax=Canarypox virus TaxID=44088 RepID=Q6VZX6_CNPV|nr:CNPV021 ankyrin repeat protein [Canarypox virus]AAR83367.1 CNPV021 ankyrin repeat protein [Canarypox virus]AWD84497.1 ankyrin repeat protein [Canarypox virus]
MYTVIMCIQLVSLYRSMYKDTDDDIIKAIEHYRINHSRSLCNEGRQDSFQECTIYRLIEFIRCFNIDDDNGEYNRKVFFPVIILHQAIEARRYNVVKYILDRNDKLDMYVDEYTQYHPLHVITSVPKSRDLLIFMISEDKLDIVNEACIRSEDIGLYKSTFIEVIKEVANGKTVFTDNDLRYLEKRIRDYEYKIASLLIAKGANINAMNRSMYTALRNTIINGNLELTKLLLDEGADKDIIYDDLNIFELSVLSKNVDVVKEIVNRYGIDYKSNDLMYNACIRGCNKVVEYLINLGFDVNQKCNFGEYPLHAACRSDSLHIVNILLSNSAIVDQESSIGNTPLMLACNNPNIVKLLLDKGANPCAINSFGMTVIETAINCTSSSKYLLVSRLILLEDIYPDVKNELGFIISMKIINENYELRNFKISCLKELDELRSIKLNTKYSLYVFITSSNKKLLSKLVNNTVIDSLSLTSYPIYFELLSNSISNAKKLRNKIESFISNIDAQPKDTYWSVLPLEIKYRVVYLLDSEYLINM